MINNISAIGLMFAFFIFLYFFCQYFKTRFQFIVKDPKMMKLGDEMDVFMIVGMLVTILIFTSLLMQSDEAVQNNHLAAWFGFITVMFGPFVLIFIIIFIRKLLRMLEKRSNNEDNDDDQ